MVLCGTQSRSVSGRGLMSSMQQLHWQYGAGPKHDWEPFKISMPVVQHEVIQMAVLSPSVQLLGAFLQDRCHLQHRQWW